jgi:DNA-directed RNA polymerase specialized sigma24 family protein
MEERHIADVALLMERSQGAVKTLQYRALHALAGLLGGQRRQQKG